MQKTLTPKPLPDQIYGREQVMIRLKRAIPWQRLSEEESFQGGGEKPKPFVPDRSIIAPIKREARTFIDPKMQVRRFAQKAQIIEEANRRREMDRLYGGMSARQDFFNVTHTRD